MSKESQSATGEQGRGFTVPHLPLSMPQLDAITHFLNACIVPIFNGARPRPQIHGTGFFFRLEDRTYLISAGHVIDVPQPELLAIPTKPGGPEVRTLGKGLSITTTDLERLDVGALRLEDEDVIGELGAHWTVLSPEHLPREELVTLFLIAGYPDSQTYVDGPRISSRPIQQIYSTRYDGPTDEQPDPYDFFFRYSTEATARDGEEIKTPALHGVSGAPVWGIRTPDPAEIWSPERALALVGVEFAFAHSKYIRAKSWQVVHALLTNAPKKRGDHG